MQRRSEYSKVLLRSRRSLMLGSFTSYVDRIFESVYKTKYIFGRHHLEICQALDDVVKGKCRKLIINIAPRYGKTELAVKLFISWCFALNPMCKFIHLSYSSTLVEDNSDNVKAIMKSDMYRYIFPYAQVSKNKDTKRKWDTTEGGGFYAVSTLGQITGFGAGTTDKEEEKDIDKYCSFYNPDEFSGAIVIDDPIKPEDALSDNMRELVNRRFETTIRNRVNSRKTPIIIICQRTHERDLCGYLMDIEPDEWTVLSLPVISFDEDGAEIPLWSHKHTLEELHKIELASPFVFQTQYMQNPTPLEGLMYTKFKTYQTLPIGRNIIKNYTDSADTGSDFLCSIDYAEYETGEMYVLSVLFTDKPMEYTEVEEAKQLTEDNVAVANIEGNNGGRGYARNVEKNARTLGNGHTRFVTFTQSHNKEVRIFTNSAEVQNLVYFPEDWQYKWPQFYNSLTSYRKTGKNKHDDAPDAVTGMVEKRETRTRTRISRT